MDKLQTVAEVADFLGCSESWLNKARWKGGGPHYVKMGRKVMYRIDDVQAWLEEHRFKSTVEYSVTAHSTDNM